jgi:CheY-like chemotaxis protein
MPDQINILVIDDEQIMREGCSRILSKDGWAVICAENGTKGLDEIKDQSEKIDVILLDLMMPGMSGWRYWITFDHRSQSLGHRHHRICDRGVSC